MTNPHEKESLPKSARRLYYTFLSLHPNINPCPSCPYECVGKRYIGGDPKQEIVGCSRWP